jgi:hypothetical protein
MKSASPFQKANRLSVYALALGMLFSCEPLASAAVINQQPHSTNVLAGSNATFTVGASGAAPLRYRWMFNGTNLTNGGRISGATSSNLTITAVVAGDAGGYRVVVSNSVSSVTSSVATLTVLLPPSIITPPANQTTYVGGAATFSSAATGTAPLNFRWFFGGALLSDGSQVSGSMTATLNIANVQAANLGNYQVVVTNNYGAVTSVVATLNATNRVLYVNLNNPNPVPPYTGWSAAATNIQDAVNAAYSGDRILVANGTYTYGATANCVVVTNAISISSVSGAAQTIIDGGGTKRCVYLAGGATLTGLTLTNGATSGSGGGVYCESTGEIIANCVLTGNQTTTAYANGGGANGGTLSNCVVVGNVAFNVGGGANGSTVIQSLILSNAAPWGGGINGCTATSCVLQGNTANNPYADSAGGGGANGCTLSNCLIIGNATSVNGGGAMNSLLINCTVAGNYAHYGGGGLDTCAATNCIVYYNSASFYDDNYAYSSCSLSWCCTTPLWQPPVGVSNIDSAPLFADVADGNYRLYPGSPCIDAGNNAVVPASVDIDGNSRIVNGTVDLGAYEFQNTPFIEVQPTNQTAPFGQPSLSFSIVAVGPGTLTYQWLFNGTNIGSATNSTLTLNFLQYSNAGTYSVVVTNGFGATLSSNAVLMVVPPTPPTFVSQATNQTVPVGSNVTLTVLATGAPLPAYQWYFNGVALTNDSHYTGTTGTNLQVSGVQTGDTGNYFVIATNIGGAATSLVATVTVLTPPALILQPVSQTLPQGSNVTFTAAVSGDAPLNDQWFFNGTPLTDGGQFNGTATTNLTISNLQFTNNGNYVLRVTNLVGSAISTTAVLTVLSPPAMILQPSGLNVLLGSNASFSAVAVGTAPLSYQWYLNGAPLIDGGRAGGATTTNLNIANVQTNDAGPYQLVVTNSCGAATSAVAVLSVQLPVAITNQPANQLVIAGSNATFTVGATGFMPPAYLWYSNGVALTNGGRISGASSATLTIAGVQTNDGGAGYQVVVTNNYGSATSSLATLTVYARVQITGQPSSQAVLLGSNATFTVTAVGSVLGCQWLFNGTPLSDGNRISGSATPMLTVSNVHSSDAGGYVAVVTNPLSSATSRTASLTPQSVLAPSVRYVALTCTNPLPPYLDWTTAATNIQDAIDASIAGDLVLVSNGVYSTGGRAVYGQATNRVTVDRAITVQSANGPASTFIQGDYTAPTHGGPNSRCAYLTNGAVLSGFTLTNGGTIFSTNTVFEASGGGVWCESSSAVVSNCVLAGNIAAAVGGGAFRGTLFNCLLTNNFASQGAGACSNTLFNCTITRNTASYQSLNVGGGALSCILSNCLLVANYCSGGGGGGAALSTLVGCVLSNNAANSGGGLASSVAYNCLISSNRASGYGGGAYSNMLINCIFTNNFAEFGGAAAYATLIKCAVIGNRAQNYGGGTYLATADNCLLTGNFASMLGGAADGGILKSCTVVSNLTPLAGGVPAVYGSAVTNCIIYDNAGGNIVNSKSIAYTCSSPLFIGSGNFTNAPLFVNEAGGDFHLQSNSPCINSGNNAYVSVTNDFDGNPRIVGGTVDIGAYEYQTPGSVISYAWLQQYGLPTDGSADYADPDGDGMNNWQEWKARTNPTNALSVLKMQSPIVTNSVTGIIVSWQSVSGVLYYLQRSSDLTTPFSSIQSNIVGQAGTTSVTDPTATNASSCFYRVGVQP